MSKSYLLIFTLIIYAQTSHALETMLFGGGGDPFGASTIFDESLKKLALAKDGVNLKIQASFDGGHSDTEAIIKNSFGVQNKDFTPDNFEKAIADYAQKIKSGQIKPGEKLLVLIDTHGEPNDPKSTDEKSSTHLIDMATRGATRGARLDSMDKLKELAQVAKDYNIKLGIVDFSCHSGNSLPLANENTCVVTSTAPNLYGYSDFSNYFYENMKKGESLESVFLKARSLSYSQAFPMISTGEGKQLNETLFPLIHPYMLYSSGLANKLTPYLEAQYVEGSIGVCKRESEFNLLIKQIEDFQKVNGVLKSRFVGDENLLEELKSYKKMQDKLLQQMNDNNYGLLKNEEKYYPNDKNKKNAENISWDSALDITPAALEYFEDLVKKATSAADKKDYLQSIKKLKFTLELKKKILAEHPELQQAANFNHTIQAQGDELKNKASHISQISSRLYDAKYKELKETSAKKSNACSDFVF